MSDKINVQEILSNYSLFADFDEEEKESLKTAIKEIVEAVVDKCTERVSFKTVMIPYSGVRAGSSYAAKVLDQDAILQVKQMIDYGI